MRELRMANGQQKQIATVGPSVREEVEHKGRVIQTQRDGVQFDRHRPVKNKKAKPIASDAEHDTREDDP